LLWIRGPFDVLGDLEVWQHLHGIVVEELVHREELMGDGLDALLSHNSSYEGAERVEDSLALEREEVEESHHLRVIREVLLADLALDSRLFGDLDEFLGVAQIPDLGQPLVLSPECLQGEEAQV